MLQSRTDNPPSQNPKRKRPAPKDGADSAKKRKLSTGSADDDPDNDKNRKRARPQDENDNTGLAAGVIVRCNQIEVQAREKMPQLEAEVAILETRKRRLEQRDDRRNILLQRELDAKIKDCQGEIANLKDGKELKEFVSETEPLVKRLKLLQDEESRLGGRGSNPTWDEQRKEEIKALREALDSEFRSRYQQEETSASDFVDDDICPRCHSALINSDSDSKLICPTCAVSKNCLAVVAPYGEDSERAAHEAPRHDNFRPLLQQYSMRKGIVPEWVYALLRQEFLEMPQEVEAKCTTVQRIMRRLGLPKKYVDRPHFIANHLSGAPDALFDDEEIEILNAMYSDMQEAFLKFKDKKEVTRNNSLNSMFLMFRFLVVNGWDWFLPCFQLHKSPEILQQSEAMFEEFSEYVGGNWLPFRAAY